MGASRGAVGGPSADAKGQSVGHQRVRKGPQHQRALHLSLAVRCHAIVPDVVTHGAAIGVCDKYQQHQPTLNLLRASQHHAFVPEAVTYG